MRMGDIEFQPESRQLQQARLEHLLSFSDLFIILVGEAGQGKSYLLNRLHPQQSSAEPGWASLVLDQSCDVTQLLIALMEQLGLSSEANNRARLTTLHAYARSLVEIDQRLIICIDDADYLTDNALELLINFSMVDEAAPKLLCAGLPEFESRFFDREFNRLVEGRLHVERLLGFSAEEARGFIDAHLPDSLRLKDGDYRKLISLCEGRPDRLKAEVARRFIDRALPRPSGAMIKRLGSRWYSAAALMVALLSLAILLYALIPQTPPAEPPETRIALPVPEPQRATTEDSPAVIEARMRLSEKLAEQESRLRRVEALDATPARQSPEIVASASEPAPEADAEIGVQTRVVAPVNVPQPEVNDSQADARSGVDQLGPGGAKPKPVVAQPSEPAVVAPTRLIPQSVATVLGWPARDLTIQLLAASSTSTAERFMRDNAVLSGLLRVDYTAKSGQRYLVLYGHFSSRSEAQAAVAALPASLQSLKPWIRSVTGLQAELKAAYPQR